MFHKAGAMAEMAHLLGPMKCRSLVDGTHSMPSMPDIMGPTDVTRKRFYKKLRDSGRK